jgi:hypothetical protein
LNPQAPRIRSFEDLTRKFEQTFDALETGRLTRPKQIDGMLTALKAIKALGIDVPLRWASMVGKYGKGGLANVPEPRGEMFRTFLGLPPQPAPRELKK